MRWRRRSRPLPAKTAAPEPLPHDPRALLEEEPGVAGIAAYFATITIDERGCRLTDGPATSVSVRRSWPLVGIPAMGERDLEAGERLLDAGDHGLHNNGDVRRLPTRVKISKSSTTANASIPSSPAAAAHRCKRRRSAAPK